MKYFKSFFVWSGTGHKETDTQTIIRANIDPSSPVAFGFLIMMSGIASINSLVSKYVLIPKIGIAMTYRKVSNSELGIEIRYRKVSITGRGIEIGYRKVLIPKLVFDTSFFSS